MNGALQMVAGQAFCILQSKGREIFGMLFPRTFQGALSNKSFLCGIGQSVPRESNHFVAAGPCGGHGENRTSVVLLLLELGNPSTSQW